MVKMDTVIASYKCGCTVEADDAEEPGRALVYPNAVIQWCPLHASSALLLAAREGRSVTSIVAELIRVYLRDQPTR